MKNLLSKLALATLVLVSGSTIAQADDTVQQEGNGPSFNSRIEGEVAALPVVPGEGEDVIGFGAASPAQDMSLTDEQLEKIHSLRTSFQEGTGKKMLELKSLQRQLKDLFLQDKVDRAKASDLQSKISAIKNDISATKLTMRLDSYDVLTSEQKQKLRHKALQRQAFGGGKHGCGGKRMMNRRGGHQGQI